MNKSELVREIAEEAGLTIKDAAAAFDAYVTVVTKALKKDDKIQISGFGSFELKKKPARDGINPKTKAKIKIPASKIPSFKFGKAYKDTF